MGTDVVQMVAQRLPDEATPVEHFFTEGIYTRQVKIPAGTVVVGKRHRHSTLNILIQGSMTVLVDSDKDKRVTMHAPMAFETEAGATKAAYAHDDCVFLNVMRTDETDVERIEEQMLQPTIEGEAEALVDELLEGFHDNQ